MGAVKIGLTKTPKRRLSTLRTGLPFEVNIGHLRWMPNVESARSVEQAAHVKLADSRMNGEWFNCSLETAIEAIDLADIVPAQYVERKVTGRTVINFDDAVSAPIENSILDQIDRLRMQEASPSTRREFALRMLNLGIERLNPMRWSGGDPENFTELENRLNDARREFYDRGGGIPSRSEAIRRLVALGLASGK